MADVESVAAVWKTAAYALGVAVLGLSGTIVKMAVYFTKERAKVSNHYRDLNIQLNKALDRIGDYLRDIYNRDTPEQLSRTEFDFSINGGEHGSKKDSSKKR